MARVRIGAWCQSQLRPSATSCLTARRSLPCAGCGRGRTLVMRKAPAAMKPAYVPNGSAVAAPNSAAPIGGPASWFVTIIVPIRRELAIPSPSLGTTSATSVLPAESTSVSAVPNRNTAT